MSTQNGWMDVLVLITAADLSPKQSMWHSTTKASAWSSIACAVHLSLFVPMPGDSCVVAVHSSSYPCSSRCLAAVCIVAVHSSSYPCSSRCLVAALMRTPRMSLLPTLPAGCPCVHSAPILALPATCYLPTHAHCTRPCSPTLPAGWPVRGGCLAVCHEREN